MYKLIGDFKQYNSTIKTVLMICQQQVNGYHISENDLDALQQAINDLQSIYDTVSQPEKESIK